MIGEEIDPVKLIGPEEMADSMKKMQHRGFTPHSRYCFFKTPEGYKFVRTFDNSTVCVLPNHIKFIVNADGGSYTLDGMIDS